MCVNFVLQSRVTCHHGLLRVVRQWSPRTLQLLVKSYVLCSHIHSITPRAAPPHALSASGRSAYAAVAQALAILPSYPLSDRNLAHFPRGSGLRGVESPQGSSIACLIAEKP